MSRKRSAAGRGASRKPSPADPGASRKPSPAGPGVARISRRARRGRARRIRRIVTWVAVGGSLAGGGVALVRSSLFAVDGIEVAGVATLSRAEVLDASGLRLGMNVLSVDAGAVERRLEALPIVADARVERVYPSKVRIRIRERTAAAVARVGAAAWLVDASGVLVARVLLPPADLPQFKVVGTEASPGLRDALRLWASLPGWARAKTTELEAKEPTLLAARIGGTRIIFGSIDEVLPKMQAVVAVFERAKAAGRRVRQIDVRSPRRPAAVFA